MRKIIIIIYVTVNSIIDVNAQCPSTKYGIVPVWPQGWSYTDKENWYQMMSNKGMGYFHSIHTWPGLEDIQNNGQLSLYVDYITHLKNDYGFKFHLLIRNPSATFNDVPSAYAGLTFEDTVLINAFCDFAIEMVDSFAIVLDYLTVGGESDIYWEIYPNEMTNYVNLLSDIADYVHSNYPSIKFATTLTFEHGIKTNDTLWQLTKDFSDVLSVTYWPLDTNFMVPPTVIDDVFDDIQDLLFAAESKQIIIKESGLPSSSMLNSSETLQAQFVEELFLQTMDIDQIEIVGWDFLADYDKASVDYWVNFQQIYTPEFRFYMETLGLTDTLGNQKPAYNTYLQMLDTICSQTAVNQLEQGNNINIYTNPVNNIINVEYDKEFILEIFDVTGKNVLTSNLIQTNISILKPAIYIILIKSNDGKLLKSKKFLIPI
ncbi:MAG: T9SS type A sorting domain-containing protein [Bacteroidales bacterium]|nr:T9SS type A sorting domain-containing protein [Bacteroidales bacterium]